MLDTQTKWSIASLKINAGAEKYQDTTAMAACFVSGTPSVFVFDNEGDKKALTDFVQQEACRAVDSTKLTCDLESLPDGFMLKLTFAGKHHEADATEYVELPLNTIAKLVAKKIVLSATATAGSLTGCLGTKKVGLSDAFLA